MIHRCPACHERCVPTSTDPETGQSTFSCPECGTPWQRTPVPEPRLPAPIREQMLLDPSRFADPDPEGRYVYDDDPDW